MAEAGRPKIVLDTNVLLVSVSSRSRFHWIFQYLLADRYILCITHEILAEYEEILAEKWSPEVAKQVSRTLLLLPNVEQVEVYYRWRLLTADPDDDKFVDAAIAANALGVVTEDRDFDRLRDIDFPRVRVIRIDELQALLEASETA